MTRTTEKKSAATRNKESLKQLASLAGRGWGGSNAAMKQTFPMHSNGFPPQVQGPSAAPESPSPDNLLSNAVY